MYFRSARDLLLGVALVFSLCSCSLLPQAASHEPLRLRLDTRGPYVICATGAAGRRYADSIEKARSLHKAADVIRFESDNLQGMASQLRKHSPRYVLLFIEPQELDANFAWRWLSMTSRLDGDPFVDTRTGIITGSSASTVSQYLERISKISVDSLALSPNLIDNLGPNTEAKPQDFFVNAGSWMIPVMSDRFSVTSISHGSHAFDSNHEDALRNAGLIHFGGHGQPERIEGGIKASLLPRMEMPPCVVFNGACYTGVTSTWFDPFNPSGKVIEKSLNPAHTFCVNILDKPVLAYLAALHADHGIPVYQEMEYMCYSGNSLGDAIKYSQVGVTMANGGVTKVLPQLTGGEQSPKWTPAEVMMNGTASRVLFGDPALICGDAFTSEPFEISCQTSGNICKITVEPKNLALKSTFTDTYHSDLSSDQNQFNDRALFAVPLPEDWDGIDSVIVTKCSSGDSELRSRVIGYAVEHDQGRQQLIVQVDFETHGYMQSKFRHPATNLELTARRAKRAIIHSVTKNYLSHVRSPVWLP